MAEKKQNGSGDAAIVEIDELVSSIERMMPRPPPRNVSSKTCIFKTPEILLRHNKKAYLPNAFSIGPFHHGRFQDTEQIKLKYLQSLLSRAPTPHTNLKDLTKAIAALEGEARGCYGSILDCTKQEFTKMLVIDGCFLVELFRKKCGQVRTEEDDPVLKVPSMLQCLFHDLVLLENQIPWFVLQRLYSMTTRSNRDNDLIKIVASFFFCTFSDNEIPTLKPTPPCGHILYLLRETLILSSTEIDFSGDDSYCFNASSFPSATSLVQAGVKFKKLREGGSSRSSILDIKFDKVNGVLEISPFLIHDTTEATFRNLISFEQCYPGCKPVITSYLMLLDDLINTSTDLNILRDRGIVGNSWLDAEDATRVFSGLYTDCFVDRFYYTDLCRQVNAYCKRKWPRLRAMYLRNYFGTPRAIACQVVFVFVLVLVLVFLHTFFAMVN